MEFEINRRRQNFGLVKKVADQIAGGIAGGKETGKTKIASYLFTKNQNDRLPVADEASRSALWRTK